MKPERYEDWLELASIDPEHYRIGKDGSIKYSPDPKWPISGLIEKIRRRNAKDLESELDGSIKTSNSDGKETATSRGYFTPFIGNYRAIRDALKIGDKRYAKTLGFFTVIKYLGYPAFGYYAVNDPNLFTIGFLAGFETYMHASSFRAKVTINMDYGQSKLPTEGKKEVDQNDTRY